MVVVVVVIVIVIVVFVFVLKVIRSLVLLTLYLYGNVDYSMLRYQRCST